MSSTRFAKRCTHDSRCTGSGNSCDQRLLGRTVPDLAAGDSFALGPDTLVVTHDLEVIEVERWVGEQPVIVSRALWDRVHAILQVSPRARAQANRPQSPALLQGLIFGTDGRALSPTHSRKRGRLYRYYVAQRALKGEADDGIVRRIPAAQIEAAVMTQLRALLRQPEVVVGTWRAAKAEDPDLTEADVREPLARLEPLWDELFPAEQQRIVRSLVERVTVGIDGAEIRLRVEGLASLVRDLGLVGAEREAA